LINAALGYSSAMSVDNMYQQLSRLIPEVSSPGLPSLLVVWVTAAFVSVLIHELGHSLAFRYYGIESQIVLYHMGGLAIPTAGYIFRRAGTRQRLTHLNQIVISAAGPGLQFLTAVIVAGIAIYNGIDVPMVSTLAEWSGLSWNSAREATLDSVPRSAWVYAMVEFYVLISVWWPLFNLLPVYPLDGGHIAQHVAAIVRRTDGQYEAHLIGAIVGVAVAWWLYTRGSPINAVLFLSLAMSNFQALQQRSGPPNW
jgi:Zn-dependent protease